MTEPKVVTVVARDAREAELLRALVDLKNAKERAEAKLTSAALMLDDSHRREKALEAKREEVEGVLRVSQQVVATLRDEKLAAEAKLAEVERDTNLIQEEMLHKHALWEAAEAKLAEAEGAAQAFSDRLEEAERQHALENAAGSAACMQWSAEVERLEAKLAEVQPIADSVQKMADRVNRATAKLAEVERERDRLLDAAEERMAEENAVEAREKALREAPVRAAWCPRCRGVLIGSPGKCGTCGGGAIPLIERAALAAGEEPG